jgi:hypothetical protein
VNNGHAVEEESIFAFWAGLRLQDFGGLAPEPCKFIFGIPPNLEA